MVHNNKRYSEEFKKQIVNLHLSGKSVKALANEYGLVEQTIYKWKKLYAPTPVSYTHLTLPTKA